MPTTCGLRLTPLLVCSHPLQAGGIPLHLAARQAALKTVRLLILNGSDVNAKNWIHGVREAWWWG